MSINEEDYFDPICPFDTSKFEKKIKDRIPVSRIISKLDEDYSHNDIPSAESHIKYWIKEAETIGDYEGELSILNEAIGFYRKNPNEEMAFFYGNKAIELIPKLGLSEKIIAGTTYVNYATMASSFDKFDIALNYFTKAKDVYEKNLKPTDEKLGGLYNNLGLTLVSLSKFDEAESYYQEAIKIMKNIELGDREVAITYLNLADLYYLKDNENNGKKIDAVIETAYSLLINEKIPRDGYTAYVYSKCAPTFGYYGYFEYESSLNKEVKKIYERT